MKSIGWISTLASLSMSLKVSAAASEKVPSHDDVVCFFTRVEVQSELAAHDEISVRGLITASRSRIVPQHDQ